MQIQYLPYQKSQITYLRNEQKNQNSQHVTNCKPTNLNNNPLSVYNIAFGANLGRSVLSKLERSEGCLFGGAIGDAFGRLVEFKSLDDIKYRFGKNGVKFIPKVDGKYLVTDDTQMTLFTAEGLLKSFLKTGDLSKEPIYEDIYSSYLNWLKTQTSQYYELKDRKGLLRYDSLFSRRGPGKTCLSALKSGVQGSIDKSINNSAGNGGLMRISPIAIMYNENPSMAFLVAAKTTALTHGSPEAYLPAGFFSSLLAQIFNNKGLDEALIESVKILKQYSNHDKTLKAIDKALNLAKTDISSAEAISELGSGYTGDEALAISLYSVLKHSNNYKKIIETATNHSGDSDTTAAIAGNLAGSLLGVKSIPGNWCENIEFSNLLSYFSKHLLISPEHSKALQEAIQRNANSAELRATDTMSSLS